ncbi:hypothetical protein FKL64_24130, partial [Escherichia coli]|nr:hypothetical protein [Escherichia coli]
MSGIVERIEAVDRDFTDVLDIGAWRGGFAWKDAKVTRIDAGGAFARASGGLQVEEDRLPFGEHKFDLVVSAASLDQVPTYEEGDLTLFESGAIVLHIAETHGKLLPADRAARSRAIEWAFAALNTVEPPIMDHAIATLFEADKPWSAPRLPAVEQRI